MHVIWDCCIESETEDRIYIASCHEIKNQFLSFCHEYVVIL